jgi:molecular chaperone DnaK
MDGSDADAIKAKTEALTQAAMKLGEAMYRAQQGGGDAGPGGPGGPEAGPGAGSGAAGGTGASEGVVDADFEEVDEGRRDKSA